MVDANIPQDQMNQQTLPVRSNTAICTDFHELSLDGAANPFILPGQFATIRVSDTTTPLLRRPFAYSSVDPQKGTVSFIYQKRGPATEILAGKREGDEVDIIGPLGNSFPEPEGEGHCILLAGGIGLGPMLFLAQWLREKKKDVVFVYGCAHKGLVPDTEGFRKANAVVCTDDGSTGFSGTNVAYLQTLPEKAFDGATMYVCGPNPMMKACHELAQERGVPCFVSMEQVMACGVGACMGCVVKTTTGNGFARVCAEGPVFESGEIAW